MIGRGALKPSFDEPDDSHETTNMRFLALLLAVELTSGPVALRTSGIVVVNGVAMPDGGSVGNGDTITTGPGGLAVFATSGIGRVEVRPESEVRLDAAGVLLGRGAVATSRLPVLAGAVTIRTQDREGWYAVARRDGRLIVAAHRGSVLIAAAGAPPVLLPQGSYAEQDQEQEAEREQPKEKKKRKGGARPAAGAGAAKAGGWTIGSLSHAASVILVVGVGAGVAVTTAGLAVLNESGPSPDE
jgi:hypothetical protein